MKKLIQNAIRNKAKKLIADNKPIVVAVTGSVGKTSARNAIATVLSERFKVRTTYKNYNNEFGVPLTILGAVSPGKSVLGWLKILLAKPKDVPDIFVLEYGIDHPGDMDYLASIAQPNISVLTRISPVHAEYFRSVEALAEEKAKILSATKSDGLCVINADDPRVVGVGGHANAQVRTYGFSSAADVVASDYQLQTRKDYSFEPGETFSQIGFVVNATSDPLNVVVNDVLGKAAVSSLLPAILIGRHLEMSDEEILRGVAKVQFEPGRMNPIAGIKGCLLIDSSYNAAPASMSAALDVLSEFTPVEEGRRIAALGFMAELGQYSEQEHRMIGMRVAEAGVDLLVTVGERARDLRRGAIEAGLAENHTEHFETSQEAGRWLDRKVKKGDIVLVKGSQSARMEKVTKDLMAEPLNAAQLLVRQDPYWKE